MVLPPIKQPTVGVYSSRVDLILLDLTGRHISTSSSQDKIGCDFTRNDGR
jgi:hypothetical protein